jgi:hypothetical protein
MGDRAIGEPGTTSKGSPDKAIWGAQDQGAYLIWGSPAGSLGPPLAGQKGPSHQNANRSV